MASSGEGPVRHQVMIKLVNKEDKQKVADKLRAMSNGLPGVTFLSFNVVTDLGLVDSNADVSVICEFPDKENYLAYAKDPFHLSIIQENKPLVANRLGIQYIVPAKL